MKKRINRVWGMLWIKKQGWRSVKGSRGRKWKKGKDVVDVDTLWDLYLDYVNKTYLTDDERTSDST